MINVYVILIELKSNRTSEKETNINSEFISQLKSFGSLNKKTTSDVLRSIV